MRTLLYFKMMNPNTQRMISVIANKVKQSYQLEFKIKKIASVVPPSQ